MQPGGLRTTTHDNRCYVKLDRKSRLLELFPTRGKSSGALGAASSCASASAKSSRVGWRYAATRDSGAAVPALGCRSCARGCRRPSAATAHADVAHRPREVRLRVQEVLVSPTSDHVHLGIALEGRKTDRQDARRRRSSDSGSVGIPGAFSGSAEFLRATTTSSTSPRPWKLRQLRGSTVVAGDSLRRSCCALPMSLVLLESASAPWLTWRSS
jgi:hypothetical protein